MIRLLFLVVVVATLGVWVGVPAGLALVLAGLLVIGLFVASGSKLRCPKCQKRIKLGATRCHHCGYSTAPTETEPRP